MLVRLDHVNPLNRKRESRPRVNGCETSRSRLLQSCSRRHPSLSMLSLVMWKLRVNASSGKFSAQNQVGGQSGFARFLVLCAHGLPGIGEGIDRGVEVNTMP
jgi:hypothetical protein